MRTTGGKRRGTVPKETHMETAKEIFAKACILGKAPAK
jgi:hypothetical protein